MPLYGPNGSPVFDAFLGLEFQRAKGFIDIFLVSPLLLGEEKANIETPW
jgi:hypothetical protein